MNKIVLIGAGGHAQSCIDVIEQENKFEIVGLVDNKISINKKICNYKVICNDKNLKNIRKKYTYVHIAIGQINNPNLRVNIYNKLIKENYKLPVIKSPSSYTSKYSKIGDGTIIMHGAIININSSIGKNCIINTSAIIEHNTKIGSHCHISTKAIINGNVDIGEKTFIGSGAIIFNNIKIGKNCIIGAGSVVKKNLSDNILFKNEK